MCNMISSEFHVEKHDHCSNSKDISNKKISFLDLHAHFLPPPVNYLYNDVLPLEFFWLANCYSYLGGSSVYYLAYYSYGSAITDQVKESNSSYMLVNSLSSFFRRAAPLVWADLTGSKSHHS